MPISKYKAGFIAGTLCLTSLVAAPFTDTGSIYNQIKKNAQRGIDRQEHPKYKKKKKQQDIYSDSYTVLVNGFKVIGNDEFSQAEIDRVLSSFIGRKMTTEELTEAANALTEYYQKKGFFDASVALIKPYILKGGIVVLVVDEKHLEEGGISVENSGKRIKTQKVQKLWENIMKPGAMKQEDFERAMLLTNDFPGISAKADLYYGRDENMDDLVITVTDEEVFNGNVDIDNYGSYYTGQNEIGTTLYWNSPTKNGEEIVARFITTGKYSNYGYLDFAMPVFDNGMRLGASMDYLSYELKHQKPREGGDGTAWNATLYAKYPVVRSEKFNVETELDYVHTRMKDNNLTAELDNATINKGVFKLSGNSSDDLLLGGISYFDVSVTTGDLKLNNAQHRADDTLYYKTAGHFTKANFSFSRLQNLVGDLSGKVSLDGQWASRNLDTSEKYFLGGPYSLAGYPTGEIAGDNAAVVYADLRYDFYKMPWGGDFQMKAFYTYGWTQIYKNQSTWDIFYSNQPDDNEVHLQTVGLGVSQTWSDTAVIRVTVGKQIGGDKHVKRPYNDPVGLDYDQSDSDYRAWVEAIYYW
jgi:hemolysin activation/secretion protein